MGGVSKHYTVMSGDDTSSIASGLADAVEGDGALSAIMSGSSNGAVLSLQSFSLNPTSYRATTSSDATEKIVLGINDNGSQILPILEEGHFNTTMLTSWFLSAQGA